MHMVHTQFQLPLETREWGETTQIHTKQPNLKPPPTSAFSPCFPPPNSPKEDQSTLSKLQAQLQKQLAEAKQEQNMMLQLFDQMFKAQKGEQLKPKKGKRRTAEETFQRFSCHKCTRFYTSDSALKRHIRLKHDQLGDDPPQRYHTLHPEPDLKNPLGSSEDDSIFEQDLRGNQPTKTGSTKQ